MIDYFVGKPCTIFTVQTNRNFKDENPATYPKQVIEYFVGIVESYDKNGILVKNLNRNTKSFFFFQQIVGISEEEVIKESDPEYKKVMQEMRPATVLQQQPKVESKYIDPKELMELSKKMSH